MTTQTQQTYDQAAIEAVPDLPIVTINAWVQLLVPPPKYHIQSLIDCDVVDSAPIDTAILMERGDPLTEEGMQRLWNSSPLRQASRITTPLLILQAEEDRICPPSDNEQLFTALNVLEREVEYVLYPDEHHELTSLPARMREHGVDAVISGMAC